MIYPFISNPEARKELAYTLCRWHKAMLESSKLCQKCLEKKELEKAADQFGLTTLYRGYIFGMHRALDIIDRGY